MSIHLNMKFENICRTCLRTPETLLLSLLENKELLHKIQIISSVKIQSNDELPPGICLECVENVNRSFNFRKVIINSDIELRERCAVFKQLEINSHKKNFCSESNKNDSSNDSYLVSSKSIFDEDDGSKPITDKLSDVQEKKNESTRVHQSLGESTEKVYVCTLCNYESTNLRQWRNHKRKHTKTVVKFKVCNFCGKTVRADNFNKHIKCHTEEPVKCPYCDKMFKNSVTIWHHINRHKPEKLQCEICGQNFDCRLYYTRHIKKHTDANGRKGTCAICGKVLADKSRMKSHMRSHTGERPYVCEFCKKGFTTRYARNVHRRQHTKEKPYKCEYCSVAFSVNISLRRHVESKHKNNTASS